jgi:hypothetical protein
MIPARFSLTPALSHPMGEGEVVPAAGVFRAERLAAETVGAPWRSNAESHDQARLSQLRSRAGTIFPAGPART